MWERQEVRHIDPWSWGALTTLLLLPLVWGLLLWWDRASLTTPVLLRLVGLSLSLGVVRALTGYWFNLSANWRWHRGIALWWVAGNLASVEVGGVAWVAALMWPGSVLAGVCLWAWQVVPYSVPWIWLVLVIAPTLATIGSIGTAWLYSTVSVSVSEMLQARWTAGPVVRLEAVDPARLGTVVTTLLFSWCVLLAGGTVGGLWLGMVFVAGRLPAGYFGLGVGLFTGFVLVLLGWVLATLAGLWARLVAALYNRWVHWGGGVRWCAVRRSVSL